MWQHYYTVLIVAKCNVNTEKHKNTPNSVQVLIVAKCNVNTTASILQSGNIVVLIVAKCNVNFIFFISTSASN